MKANSVRASHRRSALTQRPTSSQGARRCSERFLHSSRSVHWFVQRRPRSPNSSSIQRSLAGACAAVIFVTGIRWIAGGALPGQRNDVADRHHPSRSYPDDDRVPAEQFSSTRCFNLSLNSPGRGADQGIAPADYGLVASSLPHRPILRNPRFRFTFSSEPFRLYVSSALRFAESPAECRLFASITTWEPRPRIGNPNELGARLR